LTNGTEGTLAFSYGTLQTGGTSASNGSAFAVGDGTSGALMELTGNGRHSFANGLIIRSNSWLIGVGTLLGLTTVENGAAVSPGAPIGKIALSNTPSLQGQLIMEVSKNGTTLIKDQLQVSAPLTYGGGLTVTDVGPGLLSLGDEFQLSAPAAMPVRSFR
jgi:hypothetical protein